MGKAKTPVSNRVGNSLFWINTFFCNFWDYLNIAFYFFFLNFKYFFIWKKFLFFFLYKGFFLKKKCDSCSHVVLGCLNLILKNEWFIIFINFFFKNFFFFFLKKTNFINFFKKNSLTKKFFL